MQVFGALGYHAASLEEIASRAGITKAVLYDHFSSKADLHLYLLERQRDELLGHVKSRLEDAGTGAAGVAEALGAFYAWAESHPYAWQMLFRETTGDPEVAAAHRRIQAHAHRAVIEILLAGYEQHLPKGAGRNRTKRALAALVGGATHGMARWWHDNPRTPREDVVALTMDVLWLGLERARAGEHWES